jgi:polyprenyldihydroxybenzoate methyltransferase/3-demethylubiquinol 3-O-methyltransferase
MLTMSGKQDGLRYLDVGCGGGIFTESAARMPGVKEVTGVDPSGEVLAIAQEHARRDPHLWGTGKLKYMNCGIEDLPTPVRNIKTGESIAAGTGIAAGVVPELYNAAANNDQGQEQTGYDIVSLWEVLEHVSSPHDFLDILTPHVKPGGWFVMSTIARTWTSWVTTKLFAEDILRIVPRGTHDWAKYINEPEVRKYFATRAGWESPRAMGVLYVPGLGWREAKGGEEWGNYLWAIRKSSAKD